MIQNPLSQPAPAAGPSDTTGLPEPSDPALAGGSGPAVPPGSPADEAGAVARQPAPAVSAPPAAAAPEAAPEPMVAPTPAPPVAPAAPVAPEPPPKPALTVVQVAQRAKQQLSQITGLEAATVSAVEAHEGGWKAYVNLVELRRVPSTSDVLATYEAITDAAGELVNYRRIRRFLRGQVNDG